MDVDAQRLTLAIHTALEAWNRAFGFDYWIDDDCSGWFVSKARRPLLGIVHDTIGPEVMQKLVSGFRHAYRTTTAWRERSCRGVMERLGVSRPFLRSGDLRDSVTHISASCRRGYTRSAAETALASAHLFSKIPHAQE
jgi:hypothetical protein